MNMKVQFKAAVCGVFVMCISPAMAGGLLGGSVGSVVGGASGAIGLGASGGPVGGLGRGLGGGLGGTGNGMLGATLSSTGISSGAGSSLPFSGAASGPGSSSGLGGGRAWGTFEETKTAVGGKLRPVTGRVGQLGLPTSGPLGAGSQGSGSGTRQGSSRGAALRQAVNGVVLSRGFQLPSVAAPAVQTHANGKASAGGSVSTSRAKVAANGGGSADAQVTR